MVSGLRIDTRERAANEPAIIAPTGDIDRLTHAGLERELDELIDGGATRIVVDLSAVGFVDSTGLTTLVSFFHRLRMSGGSLALVCPERGVRLVVLIDPYRRRVHVGRRGDGEPRDLGDVASVDCGDVMPGFVLDVAAIRDLE